MKRTQILGVKIIGGELVMVNTNDKGLLTKNQLINSILTENIVFFIDIEGKEKEFKLSADETDISEPSIEELGKATQI